MNEVLALARKAESVYPQFRDFVQEICLQKGHGFKSGLKFPQQADQVLEAKIMIRVAEKLFKELKDSRAELLQKVTASLVLEESVTAKQLTVCFLRAWREIIEAALEARIRNKEKTVCRIYDFVRAKCKFQAVADLESTGNMLVAEC